MFIEVFELTALSVRKLDNETVMLLRIRAARHGVSMEEETRQILKRAVSNPQRIGDVACRIFGSTHGIHLKLSQHRPHKPIHIPK